MSIREKDKLDLELMSYTDIAYEIIKEDKNSIILQIYLEKYVIYLNYQKLNLKQK